MQMVGRLIYEQARPEPRLIMAKSVCRKSAVTEQVGEGSVVSWAGLHHMSVILPATHDHRLMMKPLDQSSPRVIKNDGGSAQLKAVKLESCWRFLLYYFN